MSQPAPRPDDVRLFLSFFAGVEMDRQRDRVSPWAVLIAAIGAAFLMWMIWATRGARWAHELVIGAASASSSPAIADIGQAGDSFGGANALFAAFAGAIVFWAGYLQNRSLLEAKAAYNEERIAREKQLMESTLFQLLTLTRQLTDSIRPLSFSEIRGTFDTTRKESKRGYPALDSLAKRLIDYVAQYHSADPELQIRYLVIAYDLFVHGKQPSTLGPYFRMLYQLFTMIRDADIDEDLRKRYANIVRGQISEGTVLLLALNGLTERGHKFIPLIEKFGLLEHMHSRYLRDYKPALLFGYRPTAFLGSAERKQHGFEPTPLKEADYFDGDDAKRTEIVDINAIASS